MITEATLAAFLAQNAPQFLVNGRLAPDQRWRAAWETTPDRLGAVVAPTGNYTTAQLLALQRTQPTRRMYINPIPPTASSGSFLPYAIAAVAALLLLRK